MLYFGDDPGITGELLTSVGEVEESAWELGVTRENGRGVGLKGSEIKKVDICSREKVGVVISCRR